MTFEEVLSTQGRLVYTNKGVSMMPLLRQGKDIMVIEAIHEPLKKYDAVLFVRPRVPGLSPYILHRILEVNPDGTYFIIGDNCYDGEIVPRESIIGILTAVRRGSRTISVTDKDYTAFVHILWALMPPRSLRRKLYLRMNAFLLRCLSFAKRRIFRIQ